MPVIPLLTNPAVADAWHQVAAPGGYEWWYFDAEDAENDLRMVAMFHQGYVFHPEYLRAYSKYLRRPTRNSPPLPAEYPCVSFSLYRGGEIIAQFLSQLPSDQFIASTEKADVTIGPNRLTTNEDGSLDIHLTGIPWTNTPRGPQLQESQRLTARFNFKPRFNHEPMQRIFLARAWSNADHHWVVANPLCDVTGEVQLADSTKISLTGSGYHDHNYGTGPIGPGLKRWMWGRVLMSDHVAMFHFAQPKDASERDEIHLLEAEHLGQRELPVDRFNADWSRKTSRLLKYPAWVEAGPLQLVNPTVVDASPFCLRLRYEASLRGVTGTAFCQIAYPHRLRWPGVGRMIEKSIARGSSNI